MLHLKYFYLFLRQRNCMTKKFFDANQMHLLIKGTGECIETSEKEVIEVKSARDSSHSIFTKHDFAGSKFCSLNTEILSLLLSKIQLKWTELGFLLRMLMFDCASNYCILVDSEGKPITTKSIAREFNLNESTVSSYLKRLFKSKILLKSKDLRPNVKPLQVLYINPFFYKNTSLIHREVQQMFMGSYKAKSKHSTSSSNIFENFFET
jgi:predicted transcriptional regulator